MVQFPAAGACAELLLADKKDAVYESEVKNLLRELLERCCGPHVLSQILPELTSASALLYYLLVLGRNKPQQTLGEEYCDVMRVVVEETAPVNAMNTLPVVQKNVTWARHLLWIVVAVVPQYLASRSQSGWLNLSQLTISPRERMAQQLRQRQAAEQAVDQQQSPLRTLLSSVDRLVAQLKTIVAAIQTKLLPAEYEFAWAPLQNWLSQLHLAAFYVAARYLHVTKRLARIEYVFVRKDMHPALNLSLLGYVMMIRLATTSIAELKRIRKMRQVEAKQKSDSRLASQGAIPTARVPTAMPSPQTSSVSEKTKKKCALCLGERTSPAATPCGHVFCWECIVGWCQKNKPECPICRQEAHPQQIKCIYNYN